MKVKELLSKVEFDEVWSIINSLKWGFKYQFEVEDRYSSFLFAYCELLKTTPVALESPVTIEIMWCGDKGDSEFVIYGRNDSGKDSIDLIFRPWSEWLDYEVGETFRDEDNIEAVSAYILHRITYMGFSWKDVKKNVTSTFRFNPCYI